jgi:valyl-tRNA synthetase
MRFYTEKCEAFRNFANKLWNASRFVMMNLSVDEITLPETLLPPDKWILTRLSETIAEVTENLERFELGIAATKLYDFVWDNYCDWYIELSKPRLSSGDAAESLSAQRVLLYVLAQTLKLLHPFMPFITESVWQVLPGARGVIMTQRYPEFDSALSFADEARDFELIIDAVRAVRARRAEMNVPPSKRPRLIAVTDRREIFAAGLPYLQKLTGAGEIALADTPPPSLDGFVSVVTQSARLFMPMAELVDLERERARIGRELENARGELSKTEAKLQNEAFVSKAPDSVVKIERDKIEKFQALIANLEESLGKI